ncbi:MAG: type II toxin-antitoxin system VapC family toxin [Treponema sp.]|jgi:predicted nucleic acid-binding protein|nr:type II toxin-antitoxin system VapC family toxin [Treponema sp.]
MEILLDASAIMAVIVDEPESKIVINHTKDSIIVSPDMVSFEIANGLTKMLKKKLIDTQEKMIRLIENFEKIPIKKVGVNLIKSLEIAWKYKIYAYDAFYLETAGRLNIPLLTFDSGMRRIGKELGINILGGYDAGI